MDLKARAVSRVIDGVTYRCWPVPFAAGRPLLVRAMRVMGPALSAAFEKADKPEAAMAAGLGRVTESLEDADVARFASTFGDASEYEDAETGKTVPLVERNQSLHFAGRYGAFVAWLIFAMEVNGFDSFFSTLSAEIAELRAPETPTSA